MTATIRRNVRKRTKAVLKQINGAGTDPFANWSLKIDRTEMMVAIEEIAVLHNDRGCFNEDAIATLAASINERGLDNPITVRKLPQPQDGKVYELIAGERRLKASRQLHQRRIRARVLEVDDQNADLIRLEENLLRENLNQIEMAAGLKRYMLLHGESQQAVGKRFGMTQAQVSNLLRLLTLPDYWQEQIARGHIAHTVARDVLLPWVSHSHASILTHLIEPFEASLAVGAPLDRQQLADAVQRLWELKVELIRRINDEVVEPHELLQQDSTSVDSAAKVVGHKISIPDAPKPTIPKSRKKAAAVKPVPDVDQPRLRAELSRQLLSIFVRVLNVKRHKNALPLLAFFSCSYREPAEAFFQDDHFPTETEILRTLSSRAADQAQLWYDVVIDWTRHATHGCDNPVVVYRMGQLLPVDLLDNWQPTEQILDCYSDDQLQAFAHDHDVEWNQPRSELIAKLFDVWPAGHFTKEVLEACMEKST